MSTVHTKLTNKRRRRRIKSTNKQRTYRGTHHHFGNQKEQKRNRTMSLSLPKLITTTKHFRWLFNKLFLLFPICYAYKFTRTPCHLPFVIHTHSLAIRTHTQSLVIGQSIGDPNKKAKIKTTAKPATTIITTTTITIAQEKKWNDKNNCLLCRYYVLGFCSASDGLSLVPRCVQYESTRSYRSLFSLTNRLNSNFLWFEAPWKSQLFSSNAQQKLAIFTMHTHIPSSYSLIHTFTRSSHFIYFFKRNESSEHNESGALSHLEHKKCCTSSKTLSDIYIRFSTSKHRAVPFVCVLCLAVSLFHLRSLSPIFLLWSCGLAFIVLHNLHSALIYHFIHLLTHSKILVIRYNDRRFYSLFPPNQMCECVCVCIQMLMANCTELRILDEIIRKKMWCAVMSFTENWKRRLRYTRDQKRINFTTGIPQLEQQQKFGQ